MSESNSVLDTGWDIPETLALVPFLLLQVSTAVFVLCRGRKDKSFRKAFYVFFVLVTIADCTSVIANRLVFYVYLSIPDNLWTRNPSLAQTIYNSGSALEHVVFIANNCQPLCHTAIAFNRFTALALPLAHARIWNRFTVLVIVTTVLSSAVLLVAVPSVYLGVVYAGLTGKYIKHNLMQGWDMDTYYMAALIRAIVLIVCCFASFGLNMATVLIFVLRRISSKTPLASKGQDVKLFVHSLLTFALQLCLTFQCFVTATDSFGLQDMMHEYGMRAVVVVPKWLRLWSSDWLAGDTFCAVDIADVSPEEGLNYCGTLYGVLTGYLPIGHDQHLEGLIEYVFALSGAPLLLAVSGYVRNAYLQFYFKNSRRRNNRVIHVAPTSGSPK